MKVKYSTSMTLNEQDFVRFQKVKEKYNIIDVFRKGLDFIEFKMKKNKNGVDKKK